MVDDGTLKTKIGIPVIYLFTEKKFLTILALAEKL